jgi:hypothetical protein
MSRRTADAAAMLTRLVDGFLLLEGVDQIDRGEEPHLLAVMLDRLDAKGGGDVGLARAGTADQHDIMRAIDEVAAMELADQRLVDLARREVEASQILVGGQAGRLDLIGDGSHFALGHLGLQQLGEDRHGGIEGRRALLDELTDGLGHTVHLEAA